MKTEYLTELLHILWSLYPQQEYLTADNTLITVIGHGEYDDKRERFCGAKVRIGENIHHGDIAIWAGDTMPPGDFESTVLHVAPAESASILRSSGEPVPQVIAPPDPVCALAYENLKSGAGTAGCGVHIAAFEKHERVALFTRLMADRLYRKYNEVAEVFAECEQNWNETLYVMLLRCMGKPYYSEPFAELARKVSYKDICRERGSVESAEAMLLGAAGLLESGDNDKYLRHLKETFNHYCRKYGIVPMRGGQWTENRRQQNPKGIPVLRLAQLAAFFTNRNLMMESVVNCRTVADVHSLFDTEASVYWSTHYKPGETSAYNLKKLGPFKANSLGINYVVPMRFAYGVYTGDESLKEASLDLLEKITAEGNKLVDRWKERGVLMENAFDTQAVLQLNNEYCLKGNCWKCPVGKRVVKGVYRQQSAQIM